MCCDTCALTFQPDASEVKTLHYQIQASVQKCSRKMFLLICRLLQTSLLQGDVGPPGEAGDSGPEGEKVNFTSSFCSR